MKDFYDVCYDLDERRTIQTMYGTREQIELVVLMMNQVKGDSDGEYTIHQLTAEEMK